MSEAFNPHEHYGVPAGHTAEQLCQMRHEVSAMIGVTSIASQLQATAAEADAVWFVMKREPVPRLPSDLIYKVARVLGQIRAEERSL